MNFRRRLATTTNQVRVRIRLTVPSSDPDQAARRFLSSVEIFGLLLGARARGQKRYFFMRRFIGGFSRAFFRVPRHPPKKKKRMRRRGGRGQFACARPVKGATQCEFRFTWDSVLCHPSLYLFDQEDSVFIWVPSAGRPRATAPMRPRAPARPPPRPPTPRAWRGVAWRGVVEVEWGLGRRGAARWATGGTQWARATPRASRAATAQPTSLRYFIGGQRKRAGKAGGRAGAGSAMLRRAASAALVHARGAAATAGTSAGVGAAAAIGVGAAPRAQRERVWRGHDRRGMAYLPMVYEDLPGRGAAFSDLFSRVRALPALVHRPRMHGVHNPERAPPESPVH